MYAKGDNSAFNIFELICRLVEVLVLASIHDINNTLTTVSCVLLNSIVSRIHSQSAQ